MSYQPGPDDVRCSRCREWFHKALKACPMCDAPNVPKATPRAEQYVPPASLRQSPAPMPAPLPQSVPSEEVIVLPIGKIKKALPWLAPVILLSVAFAFPVGRAIQLAQEKKQAAERGIITREQFEEIQDGMSYEQVVQIVGSPGLRDWDDDGLRPQYEREVVYETGTRTRVLIVLRRNRVVDKVWTD